MPFMCWCQVFVSIINIALLMMIIIIIMALTSARRKEEKKTPWSESASELYRPSDRRLSAK
jgi:uncharacterized alpha/beta hydrolase family protein